MPAVDAILSSARRLRRRLAFERSGFALVVGILAFVLVSAVLHIAQLKSGPLSVVQIALLLAAGAWAGVRVVRFVRTQRNPIELAAWLDRIRPLGVAPRMQATLELARDRDGTPKSAALVDEALRRSAAELKAAPYLEAMRHHERRPRKYAMSAAIILALGVSGLYLAKPQAIKNSALVWSDLNLFTDALTPKFAEAELGEIKVTYRYPAYTERRLKSRTSMSGRVRALLGTEVTLETQAAMSVKRATLLFEAGPVAGRTKTRAAPSENEPANEPSEATEAVGYAAEVQGDKIKAVFVLDQPGRYRFRIEPTEGETQEERAAHEVEILPDHVPEVTLKRPTEPSREVNAKDELAVAFEAHDDFALGDIYFAWQIPARAKSGRTRISSGARGQRYFKNQVRVHLAELELEAGDVVNYHVEAEDNDTVSGPKVGQSRTQELRVYSEQGHHKEVLALTEKALDEMVHILGDHLDGEWPKAWKKKPLQNFVDQGTKTITRAFKTEHLLKDVVEAMEKDPLGRPQVAEAFEQARRQLLRRTRRCQRTLSPLRRSVEKKARPTNAVASSYQKAQKKSIDRLERDVVYLADLLNDQRLLDAEALAKELRAEQNKLRDALEAYKDAPTHEKQRLLADAIESTQKRIQEILQALSKMRGQIPQDFVNRDALNAQNGMNALEEMKKSLESGDLDAAMDSLDQMLKDTENMLAELEGGREEMGQREYSEVVERAQQMYTDLQKLVKKERQLMQKTERIAKRAVKRMHAQLGDADAFVQKQRARLAHAQKSLQDAAPGAHFSSGDGFDQADRRMEDAMRAFEQRDFGAAKDMTSEALRHVRQIERDVNRRLSQSKRFGNSFGNKDDVEASAWALENGVQPSLEAVLEDMQKELPTPEKALTPEEKSALQNLQKAQQKAEKQASQLAEDMKALGEEIPVLGPDARMSLDEAQDAMQGAGKKLARKNAPDAVGEQRRALEALKQLKQHLEDLGESGSSGGMGVPLPFGRPKPSSGQSGRGRSDPRTSEKVEIPKADQYEAPAEFRKELLEAAKEAPVKGYKDSVRRYYEELVR